MTLLENNRSEQFEELTEERRRKAHFALDDLDLVQKESGFYRMLANQDLHSELRFLRK